MLDMFRYIFIALFLTLVSCNGRSGYSGEMVFEPERLLTDTVSSKVPDYLAVLISRELTEKTTFVVNEEVMDAMLQTGNKRSDFHMCLFNGMLHKQKGNYPEAMNALIKAEEYMINEVPQKDRGLLYMGKSVLYRYMNAHYKGAKAALRASQYFDMVQDEDAFFDSLVEVARSYSLLGYHTGALSMLSIVQSNLSKLKPELVAKYYDSMLTGLMTLDPTMVQETIDLMKNDLEDKYIYWLNVAYMNYNIGQLDSAVIALDKYRRYNPDYDESLAYHGVKNNILNELGLSNDAIESQKKYSKGVEDMLMELINSDILNLEAVKEESVKKAKYKQITIVLIIFFCIAILAVYLIWFAMKRNLSRKQDEIDRQSELLKAVREELERLKSMHKNTTLEKGLRDVLENRMSIFNQFIISELSPNYSKKPAEDELLKLIESKDSFLESTCKTFEILHPEFVTYLTDNNLTEKEIGCCCLYCMGMRGNEIASYMGLTDQSYYNFSGVIRKKLGLMEYKTKLDFFLREKMSHLDK